MSEPPILDPPNIAEIRKAANNTATDTYMIYEVDLLFEELDRRGAIIARVTQLRDDWRLASITSSPAYRRAQQVSRALDGTP